MILKNICRFKECSAFGHINAVYVNTQTGEVFELAWCSTCGRIQSKFK